MHWVLTQILYVLSLCITSSPVSRWVSSYPLPHNLLILRLWWFWGTHLSVPEADYEWPSVLPCGWKLYSHLFSYFISYCLDLQILHGSFLCVLLFHACFLIFFMVRFTALLEFCRWLLPRWIVESFSKLVLEIHSTAIEASFFSRFMILIISRMTQTLLLVSMILLVSFSTNFCQLTSKFLILFELLRLFSSILQSGYFLKNVRALSCTFHPPIVSLLSLDCLWTFSFFFCQKFSRLLRHSILT